MRAVESPELQRKAAFGGRQQERIDRAALLLCGKQKNKQALSGITTFAVTLDNQPDCESGDSAAAL